MTYKELCTRLRHAGIDSAEWDAALLLEHFCGVNVGLLREDDTTDHTSPALEDAAQKREARYPLQYLLGEWGFYKQTYEVSPACLIPRPDTECLVEEAVRLLPRGAHFADLCTGSGCIAISTLCERTDTSAVAVDKFADTLAVAERNAARNGVADRLTLRLADVLGGSGLPDGVRFDAILSNPPYIRAKALESLAPELSAEPIAALDGGEDGLIFYRAILRHCKKHLKEDGFFLFEIGYDQAREIQALADGEGFADCRIIKDLGGNDRVALIRHHP